MDVNEARSVLSKEMIKYRHRSLEKLLYLIDEEDYFKVKIGPEVTYRIEVYARWASHQHNKLKVIGCIDDGSWRTMCPLSEEFEIHT